MWFRGEAGQFGFLPSTENFSQAGEVMLEGEYFGQLSQGTNKLWYWTSQCYFLATRPGRQVSRWGQNIPHSDSDWKVKCASVRVVWTKQCDLLGNLWMFCHYFSLFSLCFVLVIYFYLLGGRSRIEDTSQCLGAGCLYEWKKIENGKFTLKMY